MFVKGGTPSTLGVSKIRVSKVTGQGLLSLLNQKLTDLYTGLRISITGLKKYNGNE